MGKNKLAIAKSEGDEKRRIFSSKLKLQNLET
jgi:hypothetical protein